MDTSDLGQFLRERLDPLLDLHPVLLVPLGRAVEFVERLLEKHHLLGAFYELRDDLSELHKLKEHSLRGLGGIAELFQFFLCGVRRLPDVLDPGGSFLRSGVVRRGAKQEVEP